MRLKVLGAVVCAATALASAPEADVYPIDCAILLCLGGGFPASAECAAAKLEMIRRVTPWPIEPPLQLWNCPMTGAGMPPLPIMGADGLTPDVRQFRDGIEIYHVNYNASRNSGGVDVSDSTQRGSYDADGNFIWTSRSLPSAPSWVRDAAGYRLSEQPLRARGIAVLTRDYNGETQTEWVTY